MNDSTDPKREGIDAPRPENGDETAEGMVRVHDDVYVSIASICACQVAGVSRVGEASAKQMNLKKLVSWSDNRHGVRIKKSDNQVKEMDVFISVREGYSLPTVAEDVQRSIFAAAEKMTGSTLERVNVYVEGIEFPSAESEDGAAEPDAPGRMSEDDVD